MTKKTQTQEKLAQGQRNWRNNSFVRKIRVKNIM